MDPARNDCRFIPLPGGNDMTSHVLRMYQQQPSRRGQQRAGEHRRRRPSRPGGGKKTLASPSPLHVTPASLRLPLPRISWDARGPVWPAAEISTSHHRARCACCPMLRPITPITLPSPLLSGAGSQATAGAPRPCLLIRLLPAQSRGAATRAEGPRAQGGGRSAVEAPGGRRGVVQDAPGPLLALASFLRFPPFLRFSVPAVWKGD